MSEELIARLRDAGDVRYVVSVGYPPTWVDESQVITPKALLREAADALERAERVVEAARALADDVRDECFGTQGRFAMCQKFSDGQVRHDIDCPLRDGWNLGDALAKWDAALAAYDTTRADPQRSRTTLRREAAQRGEDPPTFDGADTVRGEEAAGIEAVRRYRRERKNQHVRGLNAEEEKK